jgi:hypothetical protein
MIPGALIDDPSGDKGSSYGAPGWRAAARQKRLAPGWRAAARQKRLAPGWRAAARQKRLMPAVVDPSYMGQQEGPLV